MNVVKRLKEQTWQGYLFICRGEVMGIYSSFKEAVEKAKEKCGIHALIIEPCIYTKKNYLEIKPYP